MSTSLTGVVKSFTADAAITKNTIVKLTTTGISTVDVATAATDKIIGVALNTVALGEQVSVQLTGTAKVSASTTVTAGAFITATTAGQGVTTAADHAVVVGRALESATAQNDLIEVQLGVFTISA
jgi:hypothetical protein